MAIKATKYEELLTRNSFLEGRVCDLETRLSKMEVLLENSIQTQNTKFGSKFEKLREETREHLEARSEEVSGVVAELESSMQVQHKSTLDLQESFGGLRQDNELRTRELCSMIEDLARHARQFERKGNEVDVLSSIIKEHLRKNEDETQRT